MKRAWSTISRRIYLFIRVLSLDVLAGVFCGYTFARLILDSDCPAITPVILCMTVWMIYTLDHLLDAQALKEKALKPAYRWHWRYRKIIWVILVLTAVVTIGLSLIYLPGRILVFGGITGFMVLVYTIIHQGMPGLRARYLSKEGWISIIYTTGIWGVPVLYHGTLPDIPVIMAIFVYLLLVLINVLIYSFHDYYTDRRESLHTLATIFGRETTGQLLKLLFLTALTLIMLAFFIIDEQAGMVSAYLLLAAMAASLGLIIAFPKYFAKKYRYGMLADLAFLLPGLLIWM